MLLFVGMCAGLFAVPAGASTLCHEDGSEAALDTAVEIDELILPCAMVESDQLGPWCVDAAVYLVTTTGTLLCRVSLPAVDLAVQPKSAELEDNDPAPAPSRTHLPAPAGSLASAVKDAARPLAVSLMSTLEWRRLPPHPVYAEPPLVPG